MPCPALCSQRVRYSATCCCAAKIVLSSFLLVVIRGSKDSLSDPPSEPSILSDLLSCFSEVLRHRAANGSIPLCLRGLLLVLFVLRGGDFFDKYGIGAFATCLLFYQLGLKCRIRYTRMLVKGILWRLRGMSYL